MNSLIRRAQQVGLARAICVLLLFALVPLRLADPRPLQELRTRTFDFFQVLRRGRKRFGRLLSSISMKRA
jgi:hypothetical protein